MATARTPTRRSRDSRLAANRSTRPSSRSADHPEIFASEDLGATPVEYVLVGLASCLTAGVAAVAQNRGIQLRSVEAKIEGTMDIQGILGIDSDVRNGYDDIKVTFNIDADASKKEIEAIVAQSQKRSAVFDVVTNPTNVTVEVIASREAGRSGPTSSARHDDRHRGRPRRAGGKPLPLEHGIDHLVLDRGEVNSWRRAVGLAAPADANWQARLYQYDGPDVKLHDHRRGDRIHHPVRRGQRRSIPDHRHRSQQIDNGYQVVTDEASCGAGPSCWPAEPAISRVSRR
jgi:uncharacterized OsmC-like protein